MHVSIYRLNSNLKIRSHREKRMRTVRGHRPRNAGSEGDKTLFPVHHCVLSCLPLPHHHVMVVIALVVLSLLLYNTHFIIYFLRACDHGHEVCFVKRAAAVMQGHCTPLFAAPCYVLIAGSI